MDAGVVHPKSPIDGHAIFDGTREIPARDIMASVDSMMQGRATSPVPFSPRPVSVASSVAASPLHRQAPPDDDEEEEEDYPVSPAPVLKRRVYDEEDDVPKKRRFYAPPPTGNFSNTLESIDYDVPAFSRFDSDYRQDWLAKMQTNFSEIHKNHKHMKDVTLDDNIDPNYLRRQYILLKTMSDATIVDGWVYRIKVGTFFAIWLLEMAVKKLLRLDIGALTETCMNEILMPYFDMAFKGIYKRHLSKAFGGGADMNPWLILGGVFVASFVFSAGMGFVERNFKGFEAPVQRGISTILKLITSSNVISEAPAQDGTSLPPRSGANETIFGVDPMEAMKNIGKLFQGTASEPDRPRHRHTHNRPSPGGGGSGTSSFAF